MSDIAEIMEKGIQILVEKGIYESRETFIQDAVRDKLGNYVNLLNIATIRRESIEKKKLINKRVKKKKKLKKKRSKHSEKRKRPSRAQIKKRREKVWSLHQKGLSIKEIAIEIGERYNTAWGDLNKLKKERDVDSKEKELQKKAPKKERRKKRKKRSEKRSKFQSEKQDLKEQSAEKKSIRESLKKKSTLPVAQETDNGVIYDLSDFEFSLPEGN